MRIVSDSCICSACLKKYVCTDYSMIVSIQALANKHLAYGSADIQIIFQVEKCKNRKIRN